MSEYQGGETSKPKRSNLLQTTKKNKTKENRSIDYTRTSFLPSTLMGCSVPQRNKQSGDQQTEQGRTKKILSGKMQAFPFPYLRETCGRANAREKKTRLFSPNKVDFRNSIQKKKVDFRKERGRFGKLAEMRSFLSFLFPFSLSQRFRTFSRKI